MIQPDDLEVIAGCAFLVITRHQDFTVALHCNGLRQTGHFNVGRAVRAKAGVQGPIGIQSRDHECLVVTWHQDLPVGLQRQAEALKCVDVGNSERNGIAAVETRINRTVGIEAIDGKMMLIGVIIRHEDFAVRLYGRAGGIPPCSWRGGGSIDTEALIHRTVGVQTDHDDARVREMRIDDQELPVGLYGCAIALARVYVARKQGLAIIAERGVDRAVGVKTNQRSPIAFVLPLSGIYPRYPGKPDLTVRPHRYFGGVVIALQVHERFSGAGT